MRKFITSQILISGKTCAHPDFLAIMQPRINHTPLIALSDVESFNAVKKSTAHLPGIYFEADKTANLLPPMCNRVFSADIVSDLDQLYKKLYPECVIMSISPFYTRSGRALVYGEVLGSVLNATSNRSASTIMAYWPDRNGTLASINNAILHVGCVQYYCAHKVTMSVDETSRTVHHVLACVLWKERHTHSSYYGSSATLCMNSDEPPSIFTFIPVQRIYAIAASCSRKMNVRGFEETVLITVPVPMRFSF